jgi:predicted Na+-dependent transporter
MAVRYRQCGIGTFVNHPPSSWSGGAGGWEPDSIRHAVDYVKRYWVLWVPALVTAAIVVLRPYWLPDSPSIYIGLVIVCAIIQGVRSVLAKKD